MGEQFVGLYDNSLQGHLPLQEKKNPNSVRRNSSTRAKRAVSHSKLRKAKSHYGAKTLCWHLHSGQHQCSSPK